MCVQQTASPNLFALQAYDTVWALAMAVEKANDSTAHTGNAMRKKLIRDGIRNTKNEGLIGDFELVDGELKRPTFEVFNVLAEKEKVIANWTEGIPFSIKSIIPKPIWPGETTRPPRINLTIGIPIKGFPEFVNVNMNDPKSLLDSASRSSIMLKKYYRFPLILSWFLLWTKLGKVMGPTTSFCTKLRRRKWM